MPRKVTWGTPGRSEHYLHPRPPYVLAALAVAAGLGVLAFLGLFLVAGLREPLSPGSVTSGHANYDGRCEACHAPRQGVSNLRCQRCHDSSGAGRLTQAAHVFYGSGSARKAFEAQNLACARCHVEHRGSDVRLSAVNEAQCLRCHAAWTPASAGLTYRISSFTAHPEFKVIRDGLQGDPRLLFSHKQHMKPMIKEGAPGEWETCTRCHVPERSTRARDLEPISFDLHCARCHTDDLTMEPVAASDVEEDVGIRGAMGAFQRTPDGRSLAKTGIRHKDEWILYNMRRLQSEVYPDAYAQDRSALEARISQLERRIYQAEPLVGLGPEALNDREAALLEELRRLEARTRSQPAGGDLAAALARIEEVAAAATVAQDPAARAQAEAARAEAQGLRAAAAAPAALPEADFESRRRELLAALDALAAADPSRKRSVDDLRRRLLALVPGEPGRENIERAAAQRRDDLARVRDEIRLRRSGVAQEVRSLPERIGLQRELTEARAELAKFYRFPGLPPPLADADRARKEDAMRKLTGAGAGERCAKCHALLRGSLSAPRPARSVMVRAAFAHKKHLIASLPEAGVLDSLRGLLHLSRSPTPTDVQRRFRCAYCHSGIEKAGDAPRKPAIPAVQSCRECHRAGATRQDCQLCHRYHPPGGTP